MNSERYNPQSTQEKNNRYEMTGVEHELVSKYQPKFLAKGGEHVVYEVPGHPDIVVKVSTDSLKKIIDWNVEHNQPIDSLPAEIEARTREYLKEEAARYQLVKRYFGADHVPSQKEFLAKVPITEDILKALYEGRPPATTTEAWGVVMVQKRVGALNDPHRLTIVAGYAEEGAVPQDLYDQVTERFVFDKNPEEKIEKDRFLQVQSHNDLKVLLEKSGSDEILRESLRELVEKIISYTQETGEIFDLAGQDNLVLSQKDGGWTYMLVDTRYPGESRVIDKAKTALLKLSVGSEIDDDEKNVLLNILNFVRTVNGLAEQMGTQKRIRIVPEGMAQKQLDFLKILH